MARDFYRDTLLIKDDRGIENMHKLLRASTARMKEIPVVQEKDIEFEKRPARAIQSASGMTAVFLDGNKMLLGRNREMPFRMFFGCREWDMARKNSFRMRFMQIMDEEAKEIMGDGTESLNWIKFREKTGIPSQAIYRAAQICNMWAYGSKMNAKIAFGIFAKRIFDFADSDVLDMINKTRFFGRDSLDYSLLACNKKDAVKLFNTTRSVLTLFCALKHVEHRKISNRLGSKADEQFGANYCDNIVQWCQDKLREEGIYTKKIWRFLSNLSPYSANALYKDMYKGKYGGSLALIQICSEAGCVPNYSTLRWMAIDSRNFRIPMNNRRRNGINWAEIQEWGGPARQDDANPYELNNLAPMIRAIARQKDCGRYFYEREVSLVLDWMRTEKPVLDSNQKKADWSWYMHQQEEWHDTFRNGNETVENRVRGLSWDSDLDGYKTKKYQIVPITTGEDLIEEGRRMHHCIASYANSCVQNTARIFSIRDNKGKRLATLELGRRTLEMSESHPESLVYGSKAKPKINQYKWVNRQCRGACNAMVDDKIKRVADQVARKYTAEYAKSALKLQEAV